MTISVTDDSFEADVLKSDKPVVVDFWAEWCGPCKQIAPALDEIAAEMADQIVVAKVNIDDNPGTPGKYGVRGIPTLLLFKDGEIVSQKVGALPKNQLLEWVQSAL
ncbi:MAG: thioredoxin TrxA [Rhodospirillales bacterium]|jgi:thioredoxin 1